MAHTLAEVVPVLDAVQAAAEQGAWCVGSVRYEAAPAFDAALVVHTPDGPLAWFAVYDEALPWPEAIVTEAVQVDWHTLPSRPAFDAAMDSLHRAIADGELYEVIYVETGGEALIEHAVAKQPDDAGIACRRGRGGGQRASTPDRMKPT